MIGKKHIWLLIFSLVGLGATLVLGPPVLGQEPLNIGLLRFVAVPAEEGVRLEWDVETELGTAGYTIKRGENDNFEYLPDPEGNGNLFVLAEGGPAQAYSYLIVDDSAVRETTYTYKLIEILDSSNEQEQAEVTVTYHVEPTSTPITFSGDLGTPGSGDSQAPTATPAATQPATATVRPPATATSAVPPTVVAPTPLPRATAVSPTAAPLNDAPVPPAAGAVPDAAYPAATAMPKEIGSDNLESLPVLQNSEVQEEAAEVKTDAGQPPDEFPAIDNPGVASALEIGDGQTQALAAEITAPVVIGGVANSVPAKTQNRNEARQQNMDDEPVNADSSRILLWVAFIVALLIFSASVIGAILLYSRRRPSK